MHDVNLYLIAWAKQNVAANLSTPSTCARDFPSKVVSGHIGKSQAEEYRILKELRHG